MEGRLVELSKVLKPTLLIDVDVSTVRRFLSTVPRFLTSSQNAKKDKENRIMTKQINILEEDC
jgi:hypothetical protein